MSSPPNASRTSAAYAVRIGRRLGVVADADAAAQVEMAHRQAEAAQFDHQFGEQFEGVTERPGGGQLRADMHREADRLDPGQFGGEAVRLGRIADVDAEFVLLPAGRDFGVGHRVDVRVDPERDSGE